MFEAMFEFFIDLSINYWFIWLTGVIGFGVPFILKLRNLISKTKQRPGSRAPERNVVQENAAFRIVVLFSIPTFICTWMIGIAVKAIFLQAALS